MCDLWGNGCCDAETFTYFCSLMNPEDCYARLAIGRLVSFNSDYHFDFNALQPEQLAQILDSNPKRQLDLHTGVWNAEQAVILATRPYPSYLGMWFPVAAWLMGHPVPSYALEHLLGDFSFKFTDNGTAFVNALEMRQSLFGSLTMDQGLRMPLSNANLRRLFRLSVLEKLTLGFLDEECALLPFSMNVKALKYGLNAKYIEHEDFDTLDIATKDLNLQIHLGEDNEGWDRRLVSFFDRVAALGHFERLKTSFGWDIDPREEMDVGTHVTEAFIRAIRANKALTSWI